MKTNPKQIIPQRFCLACRGCCRFVDEKNAWVPQITRSEIIQAVESGLPPAVFSKGNKKGHCVNIVSAAEGSFCAFFCREANKCEIYLNRPFDCRLYPFILEKRGKNMLLSLHLECPFVKQNFDKKEFQNYIRYLKDFIKSKLVKDFIKKNSFLAGNYRQYKNQLKTICTLP